MADDKELLRAISAEEALAVLRERIDTEQALVKATNARTRAAGRATVAKENRTKAINRHTANIEDVVQRFAHQGLQLEMLLQTAPELVAAIFGIQEWLEELSERLDIRFSLIERKLDMALKLQEFLLAQVPDSKVKADMERSLRDTIVMEASPANQKITLKRRLVILTNTLNKLLEREARQGGASGADVSLETAIEDIQAKISLVNEELLEMDTA